MDLKGDIIPLVKKQYRVTSRRAARAIAAGSMGGYQSMAIGLNNLPMFSFIGALGWRW